MSTSIQWTQETWNPVRGCSRISPGCVNCYAERMAARGLPGHESPTTGEPFAIRTPSGPRWTGKVELIPSMLDVPLRRRKPTTYFVNSMSDLFHKDLSIPDQEQVFRAMLSATQHTYQILTKRAGVMAERVPQIMHRICGPHYATPAHIWLGVSVEDQQRADERIPHLLQTPAAVRFLSVEPLLGPVDLTRIEFRRATWYDALEDHDGFGLLGAAHQKLDWVIVGGESGPGARPCDAAWIRSIVQQCKAAGVACFVKQLGAKPIGGYDPRLGHRSSTIRLRDSKGGDMAEWLEDLRVREMPGEQQ
jgi:protein gp37